MWWCWWRQRTRTYQSLDMQGGGGGSFWQVLTLSCLGGWVVASSLLDLTKKVRALTQPWVARRVLAGTPSILRLQRMQHGFWDCLFSVLSSVVSVPFYTAFLPIVFWSGHTKLGRQMALLMAFCDYIGNSTKDVVSAPRPFSPPVRRLTATEDEKQNSIEYGLPSSHCLNTVCLFGYFSHYFLTHDQKLNGITIAVGLTLLFLLVVLTGIGRMYLGMHSMIDVVAGIVFGIVILALWLAVHEYVDEFITSGQNVTFFWASLAFLLCFAYPAPELSNPSFQYHTAFNGVAFGMVSGIQQSRLYSQHDNVRCLFSSELPVRIFIGRLLVGFPTVLLAKSCWKAVAKWLLPLLCTTLGIPITSSCYVPALKGFDGYKGKRVSFWPHKAYDVDTGIRFLQYAGLSWSAVALVPALFSLLTL